MKIELLKKVWKPAHLAGEPGETMEVRPGDGAQLINGGFAKEIIEKKGKGKNDDEITKQTRNN